MTYVENYTAPFYGQTEFQLHPSRDPILFSSYDQTNQSPRLPRNDSNSQLFSMAQMKSEQQHNRQPGEGAQGEEDFSSEQFLARSGMPSFDFGDIVVDDLGNIVEHNLPVLNVHVPVNMNEEQQRASTTTHANHPAPPTDGNSRMVAILRHKPRGSKGMWQCIEPGERIRVDKRKGKIVQLLVKTSLPQVTQNWSSEGYQFKVHLLDLRSPYYVFEEELTPTPTGPVIHPAETDDERETFGPNATIKEIQLRVRMGSISKKQIFQVSLVHNGATIATARTIQFCSDDNGKLYTPVGRKRRRGSVSSAKTEEEEEEEENREEEDSTPQPVQPQHHHHHHHVQQQQQPQSQPLPQSITERAALLLKSRDDLLNTGSPMMTRSKQQSLQLDAFGGPSPSIELFLQNLAATPIPDYQAKDSQEVSAKRMRTE